MGYYITVEPGVKLFVEDLNPQAKRTVLFIHGWPLSHKQFEYQFNVLPALGIRCIGIDWRGFGDSDKPLHGYHYDRLSDDIRVVIDTLGLQNIVLAGHSTGGAIAIRYMTRHRGHGVGKLVLIDAAAPVGFTKETAVRMLRESLSDRPKMMRGVTESFFFQEISEPFADWFNQIGYQAAGWSTAAIIRLLGTEHLGADLPLIQAPTLIMHGVQDGIIPFSQAEEMNRMIQGSQLVPFYYSGHGPFWEERDRFNQILGDFIMR